MKRIFHFVAAALALGALIAGAIYLFGSHTTSDSYWGSTTVQRRWGIECEVLIDRNLDGHPDVRITYPGTSRTISTHDRPSHVRIDNDLDGIFEIEWRDGSPPTLSVQEGRGKSLYRGSEASLPNARLHILSREELGLNQSRRSGT